MMPVTLIILIVHIIIAIRWIFIKRLSAVINHHGKVKQLFQLVVILIIILYYMKNRPKIKMLRQFPCRGLSGYNKRILPSGRITLFCVRN